MSTTVTSAIRKTMLVDAPPERAFELFTAGIASWWPTDSHSYAGERVTDVVFEGRVAGRVYETTAAGEQDWARVLEWAPPRRFRLEWLIGGASGSLVEVTFTPEGPGTRVDLVHDGFGASAPRDSYDDGWDVVLAPFVAAARS
ncbi:MAG TPA: SRPBCC domain-containing protein [Gaiellaceae bacterium]|jgi:uncharacterized protein YndB with AHSA1/START domain|nr:SRPBCC domain-containing protein [Gaiellaceae bacterium]